ncbi:BatA domain-containing protein [Novipirellula caenicola]|uniref:Aerotolerance regulator N-terminal domain-containing protein n=1 Tax=Novipirellula caenicola TaxID=1536901 RepID=A0ABP9VWF7_9BACT
MMFLNGLLAFGALAFTIPLAIHLLYRSKFKTIQWGAMHLLEPVVRINRRRIQWMHLLLLLLRCLLPVLLAFCLSLPLLTGCRALPGDSPQTVVMIIDDSLSMAARDDSGVSNVDRVKNQLGDYLAKMSRRDEIIWMPASQIQSVASTVGQATMGRDDARDRLRRLTASAGPFDLAKLVRAGIAAADNGSHLERQVLIVSDFQSCNVNDASLEGLKTLMQASPSDLERPAIHFLNVGGMLNDQSNLSVDSIETMSPALVPDRRTSFTARIRNASDKAVNDARVIWSIDGVNAESGTVSVAARSTSTIKHTAAFSTSGIHETAVTVEHPDALLEDNRRSVAVEVIREIDVLLVDGQPGKEPLEGETDFLAIALSPFAFAQQDQVDAVRASVISASELLKRISEQPPNILVLANVASLSDEQQIKIADFVYHGGSLILFDGANLTDAAYTKSWTRGEGQMPLPAELDAIIGNTDKDGETPIRIGNLNSQYTPWSRLAPGDQRPLSGVDVFAYRKLIPRTKSNSDDEDGESGRSPDSDSIVLASMSNGDPLVVSAQRGRGRVVQFAIPADDSWTSLPLRRVYVPMMQQLALDLIGSGRATTVTTGEPMIVTLDEFEQEDVETDESDSTDPKNSPFQSKGKQSKSQLADNSDAEPPIFTVQPPQSSEITIPLPTESTADDVTELVWTQTRQAGVYRFRQIRPQADGQRVVTSTVRVAEVPAEESQLRDTEPERIAAAAEMIGATVHSELDSIVTAEQNRRYGREIWRWFLVALLLAMILEMVVQQQIVHKNHGSIA